MSVIQNTGLDTDLHYLETVEKSKTKSYMPKQIIAHNREKLILMSKAQQEHNHTNNTSLGSLLGLPVELSKGIAVQQNTKQQSNLHTQLLSGHPSWLFGRLCTGNRA